MSATRSFEVVEAELNGAPGVVIRGEIDLDAVPSLESALDTAIRSTAGAFVLDLCDLDFLDSSGLRVMLRARARLAREDRELAIVCPPGSNTEDHIASRDDQLAFQLQERVSASDVENPHFRPS